ncbi:hypothetical protein [Anaerolinea sp.]|uniref:hypothetical protein n=1 Tax=Anaerolinea sp. TaxID=1872519 RepID=UPI002ACE2D6A|nr:hypothetical protein [Anaerolinea sp.]
MEKISTVYVTSIEDFIGFLESFKHFSAEAIETMSDNSLDKNPVITKEQGRESLHRQSFLRAWK